jgi:hypothetical protein
VTAAVANDESTFLLNYVEMDRSRLRLQATRTAARKPFHIDGRHA